VKFFNAPLQLVDLISSVVTIIFRRNSMQSKSISGAVGKGPSVPNRSSDVMAVKALLNSYSDQKLRRCDPSQHLPVDSFVTPLLISRIEDFQRKVVGLQRPDGRVDPGGRTLRALNEQHWRSQMGTSVPPGYTYFSHPDAQRVTLSYGPRAVKLVPNAEYLLKSILASCNILSATLTSTLRTYHDQARITMTQTYRDSPAKVAQWYGSEVKVECEKRLKTNDIQGFSDWWEAHDRRRGSVSSLHLSNQAMDVVPISNREKFAKAVADLVPVSGSGVRRIIPKGVKGEPVDHVEFTFKVCAAP